MGVPELVPYDEFGLFHENAAEYGLPFDSPPIVRRAFAEVDPMSRGRRLSALVWQDRGPGGTRRTGRGRPIHLPNRQNAVILHP